MEMRRPGAILAALIVQWLFMAGPLCVGEAKDDVLRIQELLLTFEQGYEERDVDKYISVFSDEEYEYVADMTTPDDPSDDIRLVGVESERRAAIRVFGVYENIDLEMTDPEIKVHGDSAEARSEIEILFVTFKKSNVPGSYYAASSNTFSLRKAKGKWKIVHWKQNDIPAEELVTGKREEQEGKGAEELIRDLDDDRLGTWTSAMAALRKKRDEVSTQLIKALRNPRKNVRIRAAKVLCGTEDEKATQALTEILRDEEDDADVRSAAASALADCEGEMIDSLLLTAAKGEEPELKSAACLALARRIRKRMDDAYRVSVAGLKHQDPSVREAAAESLGIITSMRGANMLEQSFKDRDEAENVRLAALKSLKQLGAESFSELFRDALKDESETAQIRVHAARALAEAKDGKSLELLVDVAKDKKEAFELRKEAISCLGATGNSKAVKPLIGILSSSDADLRREAVKSLERLRDRRALKPLATVLLDKDEDIFVRRLAGGGIVSIDRDTAFGPLTRIVNDKTEIAPARRMAAERLALYRDDRSIRLFIELLKDEQQPWWLRRIAADRLSRVTISPCIEALRAASSDADERIAKIAQEALERKGTTP
jgi:HEAT repeat protein